MTTEIRIPGLGVSMTEGTLVEWHVADGGVVSAGEAIYTIETGKAVQDIPAPVGGRLRHVREAGGAYPVGELVGVID
jgi:pyruvate/2-oxoglutarate dehydrogenase complex dihydrolipoamide acyltransferase (E2) component